MTTPRVLRFGPYEVDTLSLELRCEGIVVPLEPLPTRILIRLVEDLGEMVPREELLELGWPDTPWVAEQSLNTCIYQIRRALSGSPAGAGVELATLRGRGYRLAVAAVGRSRSWPWQKAAAVAVVVVVGLGVVRGLNLLSGLDTLQAGRDGLPREAHSVLNQADYLELETRDLQAARALLDSGRTAMPDVAALHGRWSELSLALGDTAGARAGAARALALDPTDPSAHRARGMHFMLRMDWTMAERSLEAALGAAPQDIRSLIALAYLRTIQRRADDARRLTRDALDLDPLSAAIHQDAGMIFMLLRDYSEAEEACRQVLRFRPASKWATDCMFDVMVLTGRTVRAAEWGRRLLALYDVHVPDSLPPPKVVTRTEAWRLQAWDAAVKQGAYPLGLAYAHAANHRLDEALAALRSAALQPRLGVLAIAVDPRLATLHHDPGFERLTARLALPGVAR